MSDDERAAATPPREAEAAQNWHAMEAAEVADHLAVDPDRGLDSDEVARRQQRHGPNELATEEPKSDLELLIHQFTSPLIYILVVAFAVTILIDEYTDAAVIAAVLIINAAIGFFQERRADRSVHALMELASPTSTVVRDGDTVEVDGRELVPGDVVLLESGTRVPADLRLVEARALQVDESLLTGESDPVDKATEPVEPEVVAADRTSMAFMGSAVASGRGRGLVTAIAADTELGQIAESIREEEKPESPLQVRMNRFANVIAVAVLGSTVVAFFLGLALGKPVDEMFLTAVALAVAVVPEGLPVAFTVAMALGVRRMAARQALIRTLPSVETLGSTQTIGSDKTGTLTANQMTALRVWTPLGWAAIEQEGEDLLGGDELPSAAEVIGDAAGHPLAETLRTGVLSNEADLVMNDDEVEHRGDPTETALLDGARRAGLDPDELRDDTDVLLEIPFESDLRYSYVIVDGEDGPVLRLKGAPERVLELCDTQASQDGPVELDRDAALAAAEEMGDRGLRVLAMAARRVDEVPERAEEAPEPSGLVLTGMVGMQDPPRPGVEESIRACHRAGIRVIMITGDHKVTARAIARDLGIAEDHEARAVTGVELESMSDEELKQAVADVDVFARVAPNHKHRIVRALRDRGDIVAVTGDGVNDAPALKAADIGVAMGLAGTDVAREASDMVLTDDNFTSIANAVEEGRVVFDNVRKVTYFLLSTGAAAIVAIIASLAMGLPLPYVPAALLWLNVVTNGAQDVALAFDPGEPDVLDRPPRSPDEGIVSAVLWERTVLLGITMAAGSLWLFTWARDAGLADAQQRGAALTTLVIAMALHAFNSRSEHRSLFRVDPRSNPFLLGAVVLALAVHVGVSYWAPTQAMLQIEPVTGAGWLRIAVVGGAVVVASELHKLVRSRRGGAS